MRYTESCKARQERSGWSCCSSGSAKRLEEVLTPCRDKVVLIVLWGLPETLLSLETFNFPWGSGTRHKMLTEPWSSCLCAFSRAGGRWGEIGVFLKL